MSQRKTDSTVKPIISNLKISPDSAKVNQGGGALTVTGTIDYVDSEEMLSGGRLTLVAVDSNNNVLPTLNTAIATTPGEKNGTLTARAVIPTSTQQTIKFSLYVTDTNNNQSNTLTGTFIISP
ncbi:MAG: hypothetical protein HYV06_08225 [Deltaproteobacteria bacterium]|nr:hypothetical protein [Deltaproteobacteria bacterium]